MRRFVMVFLALALLPGCSHISGGVAPSTVPLAPGGYMVVRENVQGSDCRIALFGILPLTGGNKTAAAVRAALSTAPGADALINVSVDTYAQFWILWSNTCTVVQGTAVKAN